MTKETELLKAAGGGRGILPAKKKLGPCSFFVFSWQVCPVSEL